MAGLSGITAAPWRRGACAAVVAAVSWVGVGSAQAPGRRAGNLTVGCLERFDPAVDYFPDKAAIEDAANFSVTYYRSYKVVSVREAYAAGPPERYVLVQCGAPPPVLQGDLAGAQVVTVPIPSFFAASTTHLSLLVDLGRVEVLTGVAAIDVIDSAPVNARAAAGGIVEFAKVGLAIDAERVVTSRPALLMIGGSASSTLAVIRAAGIPVVANTEFLEPTALGRGEWLKYMALFLNEERKAQRLYGETKHRYRELSARATARPQAARPTVMTGRSTRGTFVVAGGQSYVAALIKDAGASYVWADNPGVGSVSVDLEAQIQRAADADVWINGGGWPNLAAMLEDEPRYAKFKAYREGNVWVYERRLLPSGSNDYWSRSVTHPDLVLADLVKIFHPSLVPDHAFEWYMRVPAR